MSNITIEGFRLSPQQRDVWQRQQDHSCAANQVLVAVEIKGDLQLDRLKTAVQKVIQQHEILHTRFASVPGMALPLQVIAAPTCTWEPLLDVSHLTRDQQAQPIGTIWEETKQRSLDLEHAPPLHLQLIKQSKQQHLWLISLPALCADATTLRLFVAGVSRAYETSQPAVHESPESLQYIDITEWQHDLLQADEAAAGHTFWRQQLQQSEVISLPLELSNPDAPFQPQVYRWTMAAALLKQSDAIAAQLLTCWQILLWRLSGQTNWQMGIACQSRQYEELETAFGLLTKTVPLAVSLTATESVGNRRNQVARSLQDIHDWQDYFDRSSEESESDLAYEIGFAYETATYRYGTDLQWTICDEFICLDRLKLQLVATAHEDGLTLAIYYDASRLTTRDIQNLAEHFQMVLTDAIARPDTAIARLQILSDRQQQQLWDFNQTATPYPDWCVPQWFEAQVEQTPNQPAVIYQDQTLTFAELNQRANQLAHYLQRLGIQPDGLVGIGLGRSLNMVVAIWGVLKAGGAYVPLAPTLPTAQLDIRLRDTQMPVVLTESSVSLPASAATVIQLDTEWEEIAQEPVTNPVSAITPDHLAYVIYTSGSTGTPKGTLITHRGLANYLNWATQAYEVESGNGSLVHSPLSFDLTITSLFAPLLVGRPVELLPGNADLETLSQILMQRSHLSLVKLTPAHLKLLSQQIPAEAAGDRTHAFIIGGENLLAEDIAFWQTTAPHTRLINEYGPTETVVGCCVYQTPTDLRSGSVPIGKAIANTQLYVLDDFMQPVPIGVPGELYIGGAGVARGYLNRPDLTAERFVLNPFGGEEGRGKRERGPVHSPLLYKTGDRVRYLPDGNIEFLGRMDDQVKIRGYRVELGEVAAVLSQHPAVEDSVAIAHAHADGHTRLIAYVVPGAGATIRVDKLRQFLQTRLPDYMIPAQLIWLDRLPLTRNGKVDRRALPEPDTARPDLAQTFVAASNPTEAQLAAIWGQVLGMEQVGIHDNFFELGGDSILSLQVVAKANQAGLHLLPKQMFQHQTIAQLAAVVQSAPIAPTSTEPVTGTVPLTPIQSWFFEQQQPEPHHWNQAVLLEVPSDLNADWLYQSLQYLVQHHDALRLRFKQTTMGWQQHYALPDGTVPFSQVDLRSVPPEQRSLMISETATSVQRSLDLSQVLLRVVLFDLDDNQPKRLLWVCHHLAIDSISWRILLDDCYTLYQQAAQGRSLQLPAKTTSFQQWAQHLQTVAQSPTIQVEQAYWQSVLSQPSLSLPLDFPEGKENAIASTQTFDHQLSSALTQTLLQDVPRAYRTEINDVLLTALVQTVTQWAGSIQPFDSTSAAVLIELEGHGRDALSSGEIDLSRTVGWFTSLFPVRLELPNATDLGAILLAVKEQLRVPQRGIGYGLWRYLNPGIHHLPTRQPAVSFNYLGQFDALLQQIPEWRLANESTGESRSPEGKRLHVLELNSLVMAGQLQVEWSYSTALHKPETIAQLAQRYEQNLEAIAQHCSSSQAGGFSPSDFPLAGVSQADLNKLMSHLN
ncbi:MAG: amino acid adenylation domain-containing protein [Leptolyngbya sp. SIOISBB]|nr:amino acid adenylation domain-containing protein [Leptolyngbya sp. SIOISBB]